MKKLLYLLTALLLWGSFTLFGQEKVVSGVVTSSEDSTALPGVTVLIKGTSVATVTDAMGKYTIKAPAGGGTIAFSFIGFKTSNIEIGSQSAINVILVPDVIGVDEVVVTALGIQKKARSLTYSTQQVSGNDLNSSKDLNPLNALSGKTAGLTIGRSASGVGGSSRVLIRGVKSINSGNQPLYVVDGIPINGNTMGSTSGAYGTFDAGDVISNINSEDIESINVLKGAAAAALYGSMGQNGVILITTKKGAAGITTIEFSNSFAVEQVMKSLYPELQGKYGTGPRPKDYPEKQLALETWNIEDQTQALGSSDGKFLDKFFQQGMSNNSNLSVASGNDKSQLYVSFGNTVASGIIENNKMNKNNFLVKGSSKLTKKLSVEASASLTLQTVKDRPMGGFYHNPIADAYLWCMSDSLFDYYKDNYEKYNPKRKLSEQAYYPTGQKGSDVLVDYPYWTINRKPSEIKKYRDIYSLGLKYDISNELSLKARTSYDKTNDRYWKKYYATTQSGSLDSAGGYEVNMQNSEQIYSDAILSFNKENLTNFTINANLGASNTYETTYGYFANATSSALNMDLPNLFNLSNLVGIYPHKEFSSEVLSQAIFASATVGWKNMLFLDLTARNEWSSTVVKCDPNNFFYPSVGGTFILTELTGTNKILSFAKLRATYSEVGNALPYGTNLDAYHQNYDFIPASGYVGKYTAIPPGKPLIPERSKSIEIGGNVRLFNNAIDLDATYYKNNVENQFLIVAADASFAVPNKSINAGKVQNQGLELMLTFKTALSKDFSITSSVNLAFNENKVLSLYEGSDTMIMSTYKEVTYNIVKNDPFGDLFGSMYKRDSITNKVMWGKDGKPLTETGKIGNVQVPWTVGWSNTINYKAVSLKFLIDGKIGGDMYSKTQSNFDEAGRSKRSGDARDNGVIMFEGDTVHLSAQEWFQSRSHISENYIYDATNIRLREVSVGFDIPVGFTQGTLKKLNLSVYGRNLMFLYLTAPFDPEMSSGSSVYQQGIELFSLPSTRNFGFTLRATF